MSQTSEYHERLQKYVEDGQKEKQKLKYLRSLSALENRIQRNKMMKKEQRVQNNKMLLQVDSDKKLKKIKQKI